MIRTIVFAAAVAAAGCSAAPPAASNPAEARVALQRALDGWKGGESLDAFRRANPDLKVIDHVWQDGTKLTAYEIDGNSGTSGYDVTFKVKCSQDAGGKKSADRATYTVSTTPALVVIRNEPGG